MTIIYHITQRTAWDAAQPAGEYQAESLVTQGFIHMSDVGQLLHVANAIYTGQSGLVILVVDIARVHVEIRYEAPDTSIAAEHTTGERFPHVYGALNLDAVMTVVDFPPSADGSFKLPAGLAML
ncbi:MAG: DUF952 domain-containing protein [Armatimonadetes bacterium]|nr:DUF952 domain-containing protein [Anaerolineae bacterium]